MKNLVKKSATTNNVIANSALWADKFQNVEITKDSLKNLKGGNIIGEEIVTG